MYKQNNTIAIFEYHNIGKLGSHEPWTVSVDDFKAQMAYITFDDGYRSNYLLAYPILKQYRIPATIFIIVKNIKNGTVGSYSAMRWDDLHAMVSSGLLVCIISMILLWQKKLALYT